MKEEQHLAHLDQKTVLRLLSQYERSSLKVDNYMSLDGKYLNALKNLFCGFPPQTSIVKSLD